MSEQTPLFVLASRNVKKAAELAALFQGAGLRLAGLTQFPDAPEVEETGETFAENAALKAKETARAIGHWTLADDSGLMVDALGGRPGVRSARYAGDGADDSQNNAKLLEELANVPDERRGAQFVCHLAVSDPQGNVRLSIEDHCRGRIVNEHRGGGGFGYDPLFLIPEYGRTFGELAPEVKGLLSHRARAMRRLLTSLRRLGR